MSAIGGPLDLGSIHNTPQVYLISTQPSIGSDSSSSSISASVKKTSTPDSLNVSDRQAAGLAATVPAIRSARLTSAKSTASAVATPIVPSAELPAAAESGSVVNTAAEFAAPTVVRRTPAGQPVYVNLPRLAVTPSVYLDMAALPARASHYVAMSALQPKPVADTAPLDLPATPPADDRMALPLDNKPGYVRLGWLLNNMANVHNVPPWAASHQPDTGRNGDASVQGDGHRNGDRPLPLVNSNHGDRPLPLINSNRHAVDSHAHRAIARELAIFRQPLDLTTPPDASFKQQVKEIHNIIKLIQTRIDVEHAEAINDLFSARLEQMQGHAIAYTGQGNAPCSLAASTALATVDAGYAKFDKQLSQSLAFFRALKTTYYFKPENFLSSVDLLTAAFLPTQNISDRWVVMMLTILHKLRQPGRSKYDEMSYLTLSLLSSAKFSEGCDPGDQLIILVAILADNPVNPLLDCQKSAMLFAQIKTVVNRFEHPLNRMGKELLKTYQSQFVATLATPQ
ncbi:hypothetical protein [Biostraticola tofi]|nr:hypothetical protein [Biostraticola tofi]